MKPRVFIASSTEGLDIAKVINLNLDHVSTNTMWTDVFQLSSIALPSLVEQTKKNDFAIFVFSPDDGTEMRGTKHSVVRDNVLFELGLFIGALGAERCFVVKPRNTELHIPTDLLGVTFADYDENRPKTELTAALNAPCTRIEHSMHKVGVHIEFGTAIKKQEISDTKRVEISSYAKDILLACLHSHDELFNLVQLRNLESKERAYFKRGIDELSNHGFLCFLRRDLITKELVYQMSSSGRDFVLDNNLAEDI